MPTINPVIAKRLAERLKKLYGKTVDIPENLNGSTPPSCLITVKKYPKVYLGVLMSNEENSEIFDNPSLWNEKEFPCDKIIEMRMKLINARVLTDVNLAKRRGKIYEEIVEGELSIRSVDIEAKIRNPNISNHFSKVLAFYGLKAKLKEIKITDNPKIPYIVDRVINEEIKAREAVITLYEKRLSDYYIARIFSLGLLGIDKRLVPSKWSITAVQKIIIEHLEKELRNYNSIQKVHLFYKKFYGNVFFVVLFPGNLKFELIEAILPGSAYNPYYNFAIIGRDDESGGFYASKLSFLEFLRKIKRKANCVVFRIVTKDYYLPLGVWVVREGIKRSFYNKIGSFESIKEALEFLNSKLEKYNLNIKKLEKYSNILRQKTLFI